MNKFVFYLIFLGFSFRIFAQEIANDPNVGKNLLKNDVLEKIEKFPPWVMVEYAKKEIEMKKYPNAMIYLFEALKKNSQDPNILFEIGVTYKMLGEYDLAFEYLKKILNEVHGLDTSLEYKTYYEIADLGIYEKDGSMLEKYLAKIVERDPDFIGTGDAVKLLIGKNDSYYEVLTGRRSFIVKDNLSPLDQLIYMYRIKDSFSQKAHFMLGKYYFQTRQYSKAILHLTYSIIKVYTRIIDDYIDSKDFSYEFDGTKDLLNKVLDLEGYSNYIEGTNFFEALNYLTLSLLGSEEFSQSQLNYSKDIWHIIETYSTKKEEKSNAKYLLSLNTIDIASYIQSYQRNYNFKY